MCRGLFVVNGVKVHMMNKCKTSGYLHILDYQSIRISALDAIFLGVIYNNLN